MLRLERISHICIIVVCLLATALLIERRFFAAATANQGNIAQATKKPLSLPGISWGHARKTAVIAINTGCVHCQDSMPFYHRLSELAGNNPSPTQPNFALVVASSQPADLVRHYLALNQIEVEGVVQVKLGELGVSATPTLIIVDSRGFVEHVFVGELATKDDEEVVRLLGA